MKQYQRCPKCRKKNTLIDIDSGEMVKIDEEVSVGKMKYSNNAVQ